jgi:hypothetical protein
MPATGVRLLVDRLDPHHPHQSAYPTLYYRPAPESHNDLAVMRRLDDHYLVTPFYGARPMAAVLRRDGLVVNRKRDRQVQIRPVDQGLPLAPGHGPDLLRKNLVRLSARRSSHEAWQVASYPPCRGWPSCLGRGRTRRPPRRAAASSTHGSGWHEHRLDNSATVPSSRTAGNATFALNRPSGNSRGGTLS